MIEPSRALEHLGELGLDEETTELFLSGNARRVFRLGDHS
jgi:predicted TIM-barrel fold metal-dependent hydrolase